MSNTDYSQTTLAIQKGAQAQFAGYVSKGADAARTVGLVRMSGGADASVAVATALGATVAGATKVGFPLSANAYTNTYSLSRSILAAAR